MSTLASPWPSLQAIEGARRAIADKIRPTPTRPCPWLSERAGAEVFLKYEVFQTTGSFKVRGALHKMLCLSDEERRRGVVAASAGNHAQGVAFGSAALGVAATIVMPEDTPLVKVNNTRALGESVQIVLHGTSYHEAYAHAVRLRQERGAVFLHPYDDEQVIAGQGTLGLELAEEVPGLDAVVVPIGGGGLISGIAAALKEIDPGIDIYGVQTESAPAMERSLAAGSRTEVPAGPTIADGIRVRQPGKRTYPCVEALVQDVVLVQEEPIEEAIIDCLELDKTLVEGAAAAGLAALQGPLRERLRGRRVAAVLCGGNIDLNTLSLVIERSLARRRRLARLRASLVDRPGCLRDFLGVIAAAEGNVVRIFHDRVFGNPKLGRAEVVVDLEVRDDEHVQTLLRALHQAGHDNAREQPYSVLE